MKGMSGVIGSKQDAFFFKKRLELILLSNLLPWVSAQGFFFKKIDRTFDLVLDLILHNSRTLVLSF